MRVVSWNVAFRSPETAERQGDLLRELAPDLILLQEVNPRSSEVLCKAAGADWMVRAIDLCPPESDGLPTRRLVGVAIAGRGMPVRRKWLLPRRWWLLNQIRFPERVLLIKTQTERTPFIAASYHAPPGVTTESSSHGKR
jgi:hypothetical protein